MSDTRQCVLWSLERACTLRSGQAWQFPVQTYQQLSMLQTCSTQLSKNSTEIVDGMWVTGKYWGRDSKNRTVYIPSSGIPIDEIGQTHGGWERVRNTCANCEANTLKLNSPVSQKSNTAGAKCAVGGCFGSIEVIYPASGSLDELLWKIIERNKLEDRLRDAFQLTDPLWFGFWMTSPLDQKQCRCLLELLPEALPLLWQEDESDPGSEPVFNDIQFAFSDFDPADSYGKKYASFFRALDASIKHNLPLHIHVPPPGHCDLGWFTTFAHCPRCKVEADVPRWQNVESREYECTVCGNRFDPATTYTSNRDDTVYDADSLEQKLGEKYESFVISYGLQNGCSERRMLEALDIHRDGPNKRRVQNTRARVNRVLRKFGADILQKEDPNLSREICIELAAGVGMELILAPAGEFQMGELPTAAELKLFCPNDTNSADDTPPQEHTANNQSLDWCETLPLHTVQFKRPFYIGKYPVTQAQWKAVMGSNPSKCRSSNHPVEQVDWFTAQEFCARLSQQIGRAVRLPSEAEWEYACRAGTTTRCHCGEIADSDHANLDDVTKEGEFSAICTSAKAQTTPVDKYPPNSWGIYDMLGNVGEWCQDSWHENYLNAPTDGTAWIDSPEPVEHVARGGAAYVIASRCTSGSRRSQRANCGASPRSDDADNDESLDIDMVDAFLSFNEFNGLRLVCDPILEDRLEP